MSCVGFCISPKAGEKLMNRKIGIGLVSSLLALTVVGFTSQQANAQTDPWSLYQKEANWMVKNGMQPLPPATNVNYSPYGYTGYPYSGYGGAGYNPYAYGGAGYNPYLYTGTTSYPYWF
jgi:hypothetical protein